MKPEHDLRADSTQTERSRLLDSVTAVQRCEGESPAPRRSPERRRGFVFGDMGKKPSAPDEIVAGASSATRGYELLAGSGALVSWHEDLLDAFDAIRAYRGPAKVVRCADRALLRVRHVKAKP